MIATSRMGSVHVAGSDWGSRLGSALRWSASAAMSSFDRPVAIGFIVPSVNVRAMMFGGTNANMERGGILPVGLSWQDAQRAAYIVSRC